MCGRTVFVHRWQTDRQTETRTNRQVTRLSELNGRLHKFTMGKIRYDPKRKTKHIKNFDKTYYIWTFIKYFPCPWKLIGVEGAVDGHVGPCSGGVRSVGLRWRITIHQWLGGPIVQVGGFVRGITAERGTELCQKRRFFNTCFVTFFFFFWQNLVRNVHLCVEYVRESFVGFARKPTFASDTS